ncbi:hypothetical protein EYZ11_005360 [Aspergillus tanneri]|uniref:Major facilitator superfamily (MFS) profile domain-containing protein n=1 Tax=Aspergillus tanneri TaxID=1220188 RepID=A0A4S3JKI0_9EURO|nr:hypothetical protein EYZ11_005360 [Aspergillus tanneri]
MGSDLQHGFRRQFSNYVETATHVDNNTRLQDRHPSDYSNSGTIQPPKEDDSDSVSTVIYDGASAETRILVPSPDITDRTRFPSYTDGDSYADECSGDDSPEAASEKPVTWRSLPKKGQLAILTFARLSEPLTQTSLQAYMFYQLRSFDPSLPDSTISTQAGVLQGSFTAAQFLTAVWWGRLADAEWMGRKRVLMIGLLGTCISCLGFGFARSFVAAAFFRILGGVLNSNVGVMRTMIAEIIQEKNRRPRYYRPLVNHTDDESLYIDGSVASRSAPSSPSLSRIQPRHKRPGFCQIWTPNVLLTLLVHFLLAFHTSAFNSMTFVFLPTPRAPEGSREGFFHFGGGLGLPSARVGLATAIIGIIGLPLQIFIYPQIQSRLGTLSSFRTFLPFSPLAYALMPFLVLIPRFPWLVWPAFTVVVGLQVISRTFALPAAIILVNNSVTNPSVLGTIHGVAQSIASGARTLGPMIGGWGLGLGLKFNMVGAIWWALAMEALAGWLLLWSIYEGQGIGKNTEEEPDRTR